MFQTSCVAEDGKKRETGYTGGGGRIGMEYFNTRKAADIGKEAARISIVNLSAQEAEAGVQAVRTGEKVPVALQPKPGPSTGSANAATTGSADGEEPGITEPDLIGRVEAGGDHPE